MIRVMHESVELAFLLGVVLLTPIAVAAVKGSFEPLEAIYLWLPTSEVDRR